MALAINMNLNDNVWVELEENGWKAIRDAYVQSFGAMSDTATVNGMADKFIQMYISNTKTYLIDRASGRTARLTRMQLHELMHLFGRNVYNGQAIGITNNTVYLTVENFIEMP